MVFARLIDEAIPGICGFLRSSQTSDILEAVSFFVTGECAVCRNGWDGVVWPGTVSNAPVTWCSESSTPLFDRLQGVYV